MVLTNWKWHEKKTKHLRFRVCEEQWQQQQFMKLQTKVTNKKFSQTILKIFQLRRTWNSRQKKNMSIKDRIKIYRPLSKRILEFQSQNSNSFDWCQIGPCALFSVSVGDCCVDENCAKTFRLQQNVHCSSPGVESRKVKNAPKLHWLETQIFFERQRKTSKIPSGNVLLELTVKRVCVVTQTAFPKSELKRPLGDIIYTFINPLIQDRILIVNSIKHT